MSSSLSRGDIPTIDLSCLDEAQRLVVLEVLKRDEELRIRHDEKITKLKQEILKIEQNSGDIPNSIKTETLQCIRCRSTFSVFNPAGLCPMCEHRVCKNCRVVTDESILCSLANYLHIKTDTTSLCLLCHKIRQLLQESGEWMTYEKDSDWLDKLRNANFNILAFNNKKMSASQYLNETLKQRFTHNNTKAIETKSISLVDTDLNNGSNENGKGLKQSSTSNSVVNNDLINTKPPLPASKSGHFSSFQPFLNRVMNKKHDDNKQTKTNNEQKSNNKPQNNVDDLISITSSEMDDHSVNGDNLHIQSNNNNKKANNNINNNSNNNNNNNNKPLNNSKNNFMIFNKILNSNANANTVVSGNLDHNNNVNNNNNNNSNTNNNSNSKTTTNNNNNNLLSVNKITHNNNDNKNKSSGNNNNNSENDDDDLQMDLLVAEFHKSQQSITQNEQNSKFKAPSILVKDTNQQVISKLPPSTNAIIKNKEGEKVNGNSLNVNSLPPKKLDAAPSLIRHGSSASTASSTHHIDPSIQVKGKVFLKLSYDRKTSNLSILIDRCEGLAAGNQKKNTSDPYVKLYLYPDKNKANKRKTSIKKNTCDPKFNENLRYTVPSNKIDSTTLVLSVLHYDRFGHNKFLGETKIRTYLNELENPSYSNILQSYDLSPRVKQNSVSKTEVSFELIHTPSNKGAVKGILQLHVLNVINLEPIKSNGLCDTFVEAHLLPDRAKSKNFRSKTIKNNLFPEFDKTFEWADLSLEDLKNRSIELTIWSDELLKSQLIGGIRLNKGDKLLNGAKCEWMDSNNAEKSIWNELVERNKTLVPATLEIRQDIDLWE